MALTKVSYAMINGEVINALDYGADPTGSDDSTAAIQAAITAANGVNGTVYFPEGTYLYEPDAAFNITIAGNGILLKGDPNRSIIKTNFNGICFNVNTQLDPSVSALGYSGLFVDGLTFQNQNFSTTNTNATCFYIANGTAFGSVFIINDCIFGRYTNSAVKAIRAWQSSISNTSFYGCQFRDENPTFPQTYTEAGVRIWGADGTGVTQSVTFSNVCTIENCKFQYLYMGVDLWCSDRTNKIENCTFQNDVIGISCVGNTPAANPNPKGNYSGNVTLRNSWFESVWQGYIGKTVNPTDGTIYAPGTDPLELDATQGIIRDGLNLYTENFDDFDDEAYRSIQIIAPFTDDTLPIQYFRAQTGDTQKYRLYGNECYIAPELTLAAANMFLNTNNIYSFVDTAVTTSAVELTAESDNGGFAFITASNTSNGTQGNWLLAWNKTNASVTVINATNDTGLTVTFGKAASAIAGALTMQTASGSLAVNGIVFLF